MAVKTKHGNGQPVTDGLEDGRNLNELLKADKEPVKEDPAEAAKALLHKDAEDRAKEFAAILQREGKRLNCDLIGIAEIAGNQVSTRVQIIPRNA